MELWVRREHPLYNMRHLVSQRNPRAAAVLCNVQSPIQRKSRNCAGVCRLHSWGGCKYGEHDSFQRGAARRAFIFMFKHIAADFRHTSQPHVKVATLRPQQTAIHCAQLPGTWPAPGPGGVGHGLTSRPCNPVSTRRARGLANATESQDSQLCYRHTRPPVPRRRPLSGHRSLQGA